MERFQQLYKLFRVKAQTKQSFEITVIKEVITCSHIIWCQRNFNNCYSHIGVGRCFEVGGGASNEHHVT